jgi:hypothetical protein
MCGLRLLMLTGPIDLKANSVMLINLPKKAKIERFIYFAFFIFLFL